MRLRKASWKEAPIGSVSPSEFRDLHLVTHLTRVLQKAGEISFLGRRQEITLRESTQVTIAQEPGNFRFIAHPPTPQAPHFLDILSEYRI